MSNDAPLIADPVPALIAWFTANRARLPQAPYYLNRGIQIVDAQLFYDGLAETCAAYPAGPRAHTLEGVLSALKDKYDAPAADRHFITQVNNGAKA